MTKVSILFLTIFIILCCQKEKNADVITVETDKNLERFRELAMKTYISEKKITKDSYEYKMFMSTDTLPLNQVDKTDERYKYLTTMHKNVPPFIRNAIIEGYEIEMMTLGELLLVLEDELDEIIIVGTPGMSVYSFSVYYKKNISAKGYKSGRVWSFKYGFLWKAGVV